MADTYLKLGDSFLANALRAYLQSGSWPGYFGPELRGRCNQLLADLHLRALKRASPTVLAWSAMLLDVVGRARPERTFSEALDPRRGIFPASAIGLREFDAPPDELPADGQRALERLVGAWLESQEPALIGSERGIEGALHEGLPRVMKEVLFTPSDPPGGFQPEDLSRYRRLVFTAHLAAAQALASLAWIEGWHTEAARGVDTEARRSGVLGWREKNNRFLVQLIKPWPLPEIGVCIVVGVDDGRALQAVAQLGLHSNATALAERHRLATDDQGRADALLAMGYALPSQVILDQTREEPPSEAMRIIGDGLRSPDRDVALAALNCAGLLFWRALRPIVAGVADDPGHPRRDGAKGLLAQWRE